MEQLDRIEAKLDRALAGPESPTVNVPEAMYLLGLRPKSRTSFYELCQFLHIQPFARGKYRRTDILNAIGRQALLASQAHRRDAEAELRTEAQRKISITRINPHE